MQWIRERVPRELGIAADLSVDPMTAVAMGVRPFMQQNVVRSEAVAGSVPRRLPGGSATAAASAEGVARRSRAPNVFRTTMVDPGDAPGDGEDRLLSNRANNHFGDREGGAKSPVDLPLRLDDA